jgi:hypothetical protein
VRRPPVRRQPRTKPTPTPRAELTSFQTRLGTAFGTFHRYVYARFNSGSLVGNAVNRAGSATSAVLHDVVEAKEAAGGGTSVRALFASLAALTATTNELAVELEHGQLDTADIKAVNGEIASIEQDAAAAGVPIKEHAARSAPSGAPIGSES